MRSLTVVAILALVSACGVDGPPVPPSEAEADRVTPGVTVSGSAEFGIASSR